MREKLQKINDNEWLIPKSARQGMRVDAKIIANSDILNAIEDDAITQLTNVAMLPGVIGPVCGMPDMHWGYGLPMGAVGVFDENDGVISSGCTGFDINCGVKMIRTNLTAKEVNEKMRELVDVLFDKIPCGVGAKGKLKLDKNKLDDVLVNGAKWACENGYITKEDLEHMEENGCMSGADPTKLSELAKKRGGPQLGTLGAGNHYLEIQRVDEIFDETTSNAFGLNEKNQVAIMLHCGSRGLGHQVASDYLEIHNKAVKKYGITLPDEQLVCAPTTSKEGQDYYKAMVCAVNYAFCNRSVMTSWVRESFEKVFKRSWEEMEMKTVYDVCHNICKLEEHKINGKKTNVYIHRKGATRALPAGHKLVPKAYSEVGQPVLIGGSMGTSSYVLVGTEKAAETFFSSCHGAGRAMSRNAAIRDFRGAEIQSNLAKKGIISKATHPEVLAEEAPGAYKDVDSVVDSVHNAGISLKVTRMIPIGVIKG